MGYSTVRIVFIVNSSHYIAIVNYPRFRLADVTPVTKLQFVGPARGIAPFNVEIGGQATPWFGGKRTVANGQIA
jgi:hypothetical protein